MRSIHVPRLDLDIRGVEPDTVQRALDGLPAALADRLSRGAPGRNEPSGGGEPLGFSSPPTASELSAGIAGQVADAITARKRRADRRR